MITWFTFQLGQPIRLLLEYTGTDYEERSYEIGPPPDFDKSDWLRVKSHIGLDFPNLPYYIDGDFQLIHRHNVFWMVDTWLTEFRIDQIRVVLQKGYILDV